MAQTKGKISGLTVSDYTPQGKTECKCIIVKGDKTRENKEFLKQLGGKWNGVLGGWTYPKTKESAVLHFISTGEVRTEGSFPVSKTVVKQVTASTERKSPVGQLLDEDKLLYDIVSHLKGLDELESFRFMKKVMKLFSVETEDDVCRKSNAVQIAGNEEEDEMDILNKEARENKKKYDKLEKKLLARKDSESDEDSEAEEHKSPPKRLLAPSKQTTAPEKGKPTRVLPQKFPLKQVKKEESEDEDDSEEEDSEEEDD